MITRAIQEEVNSNRVYHFDSPLQSDVGREDMPHCNNCGDVAYRTYFYAGNFVLCQCCMAEAEEAKAELVYASSMMWRRDL